MRIKSKTVMDRMNAEKPDVVLASLEAKHGSQQRIVKLPSSKFTNANGAENNRVFLWENHDTAPYLRPVKGWKIIGYGQAPWPGSTKGFAVMLEKTTPAEEKNNIFAKEHIRFDEGTRIWQHLCERHFRELNNAPT